MTEFEALALREYSERLILSNSVESMDEVLTKADVDSDISERAFFYLTWLGNSLAEKFGFVR